MSAQATPTAWDTIVIGSGIGGLAAGAALADAGQRVLVLERHTQPGGLTQTFERQGWRFNVGVHYLGGLAEGSLNRRVWDRLTGGRVRFAPIEGPYDRVHFPGLSIDFEAPAARLAATLKARFPHEASGIDGYFAAVQSGARTLGTVFAAHSAPPLVGRGVEWLRRGEIARWVERTTWDVVCEFVRDEQLRAVLCAQWGDYGSRPREGSFALHATVVQHYLDGAWFPVGGPAVFARELGARIESAGGALRTGAEVTAVRVSDGRVRGVTLSDGEAIDATRVVSDAGLHNTLRLLPSPEVDYRWAADALALESSVGYVGLYVGLEGDIRAAGADAANHWCYEGWDVNALWADPFTQPRAPALFVSFPSLRDPAHEPGPQQRHTAEIVTLIDWNVFSQWDRSELPGGMKKHAPAALRSESYLAFKQLLEQQVRAQFAEHFPRVAECIRMVEVSTPISVATYTGAAHGAMYGLATSPERFMSAALRPRTPIDGLFLAGQDAGTPGVTGAFMGGIMAAASIEPKLWKLLR